MKSGTRNKMNSDDRTVDLPDDEMIGHSHLWNIFKNVTREIFPVFRDMDTFKRWWDKFFQGLQQEPRSTLFHLFVAVFGVLPLFGFVMFITGAFLLTCVSGLIAFWFAFFGGLMVFATMSFFILLCCAWLSWVVAGAFTVWIEWPYIQGGMCTIRSTIIHKLAEFGLVVKRQEDIVDQTGEDIRRNLCNNRKDDYTNDDSDNHNSHGQKERSTKDNYYDGDNSDYARYNH